MKRYDDNLNDNADIIINKWERRFIMACVAILYLLTSCIIYCAAYNKLRQQLIKQEPIIQQEYIYEDISRSDSLCLMATAFAIIESKCQDVTSPDNKYVGYLQMSEILVREVNNILKEQGSDVRFTYDDRHDWQCNLTMFSIIMEKHNPTLDIDKAIDIWNKNCHHVYRNQVKIYYQFLIDNYLIQNE